MPQGVAPSGASIKKKKKKKGRAPAHQNTFAFKHNPKSKKTEKILSSPNQHVCQRCYEKIEWRKQYRKYKPRTQPGRCNLCSKRNVLAAYHTICERCSLSEKAKKHMIGKQQQQEQQQRDEVDIKEQKIAVEEDQEEDDNDDSKEIKNNVETADDTPMEQPDTSEPQNAATSTTAVIKSWKDVHRVCAMCVKQPALPDPDEGRPQTVDEILANETRWVSLRERKSIERRLMKEQEEAKRLAKEAWSSEREEETVDEESGDEDNEEEEGLDDSNNGAFENNENNVDQDDPFLKAVGGADKLLTGEAYQKMLLERQGAAH